MTRHRRIRHYIAWAMLGLVSSPIQAAEGFRIPGAFRGEDQSLHVTDTSPEYRQSLILGPDGKYDTIERGSQPGVFHGAAFETRLCHDTGCCT